MRTGTSAIVTGDDAAVMRSGVSTSETPGRPMSTSADQQMLERIRAEYLEMPGMRLTLAQVQRLCGGEAAVCTAVLESLVEAKFLRVAVDGTYMR